MKEAVGGTWLFGIVIAFIVFFTVYLSMSTNYAKALKVKDEIISTIEHYKGVSEPDDGTPGTLDTINGYLNRVGYFASGRCSNYTGSDDPRKNFSQWLAFRTGSTVPLTGSNAEGNYCIRRSKFETGADDAGHPRSAYYQVVVFFTLDWPIVGALINVRIEGETSMIPMNSDEGVTFS